VCTPFKTKTTLRTAAALSVQQVSHLPLSNNLSADLGA
jgi:hypothetical protein